ncbi:hypothetical protein [Pseudomonas oryzihabitans]|uniref:hypothetical protein n=1 Tax=Pseudomonas oryzihabitans TaxID=47885 RepID=UPI003EBF77A0
MTEDQSSSIWRKTPRFTPISRLDEIYRRALAHIHERADEEIDEIVECIDLILDDYFYIIRERWINDTLENGRSFLRHLSPEDRTYHGLSYFIDGSLSCDLRLEVGFPRKEDLNDLEALLAAYETLNLDDYFSGIELVELLAALALRNIKRSEQFFFEELDVPETLKEDVSDIKLHALSATAIDAMEIVQTIQTITWQDRTDEALNFLRNSQRQLAEANIRLQGEVVKLQEKQETLRSEHARNAAVARHKETNSVKEKIIAHWRENQASYSSRAAYARHHHRSYSVTERTLYKWISECLPKDP